jgi:hypothetical protein
MAVASRKMCPHQLVAGVGFDEVLVDLRRQRVVGKRREGAADGGFAGNLTGTFTFGSVATREELNEIIRQSPARWPQAA